MQNLRYALVIAGIVALTPFRAHATVLYADTTTPVGSFEFNGATTVGSNLAANIDINEVTLAPGSAGDSITSLSFLADNFNSAAVEAQPTAYIWAADGAGGLPGTLLGDIVLPLTTLAAGVPQALNFSVPSGVDVPASMQIWLGLGYSNDNGSSAITAAELNALGGLTYDPATVGSNGPDAYFLPPGSSLSNPAVILFDTTSTGNYGWTVNGVPEPSSLILVSTTLLLLAFVIRKRSAGGRQPN